MARSQSELLCIEQLSSPQRAPIHEMLADALARVVHEMPGLGQEQGDWQEMADRLIIQLSGSIVLVDKREHDLKVECDRKSAPAGYSSWGSK